MSLSSHMENSEHEQVQQWLPWYAGDTLAPDQQARVRDHVRLCAHCRDDLEFERQMHAAPPDAPAGLDPERALARLMPRLDSPAPRPAATFARLRDMLFGHGWMPWALAGQGVLVAGLAWPLLQGQGGGQHYQALSGGRAPVAGNVLVVFRAEASLGAVQRILHANDARIVDGPTVTGAYVLDVPSARQRQVIGLLKANDAVELAEVLDAQVRP